MREASARRKTRNQFTGRRSTSVIHLLLLSFAEVVFNYVRVVLNHFSRRLQQACPRGTPHTSSREYLCILLQDVVQIVGVPLLVVQLFARLGIRVDPLR